MRKYPESRVRLTFSSEPSKGMLESLQVHNPAGGSQRSDDGIRAFFLLFFTSFAPLRDYKCLSLNSL
jgi:hypothetical protein